MYRLPSLPPNMFATSSFTPPSAHYCRPTIPAPQQDDDEDDDDDDEDENEDDDDDPPPPPPSHHKRLKRQIRISHCGTSSHK